MTDSFTAPIGRERLSFQYGRTVSRAFGIVRNHAMLILQASLAYGFVVFVAAMLLTGVAYFLGGGANADTPAENAGFVIVAILNALFFLGYLAFMQGLIAVLGAADMNGQEASFGDVASRALRSAPLLILLWLMEFIAVYIGALFIVVGIIILVFLYVAGPAMVIEKLNPFEAFGRSVALTEGSRMVLFGLHMTQLLLNVVITLVGLLIIGALANTFPSDPAANPEAFTPQMIAGAVGFFLAYLFVVPLWLGVNQAWSTSAYVELKTIKEGGGDISATFA